MKKNTKRMLAGMAAAAMCGTVLLSHIGYDRYLEVQEKRYLTGFTDDTAMGETASSETVNEVEEQAIYNTDYFSYGSGSIFVTVTKDVSSASGDVVMDDAEENIDTDNIEEVQATEDPADAAVIEPTDAVDSNQASLMGNTCILSSQNFINACLSEEEKQAVAAGSNMQLRVTFHFPTDEELGDDEKSSLSNDMDDYMLENTGVTFCKYVQITIEKKDMEGDNWSELTELNEPIDIQLDIPKEYNDNKADFFLLGSAQNENVQKLEDGDDYVETLTISVQGSNYYAMCQEVEVQEVVETPEPTVPPTMLDNMRNDDFCVFHYFILGFFVIAFTWVAAINSKLARAVFMIVCDLIFGGIAVLGGGCIYDWIFTGVFALALLMIHIVRSKKK